MQSIAIGTRYSQLIAARNWNETQAGKVFREMRREKNYFRREKLSSVASRMTKNASILGRRAAMTPVNV